MKKITYEKLLKSFLNVYFLRPENAIFCANLALSIHQSLNINKSDKIAEIATGDGIFSFLTFGGELNKSFDVYSHTDKLLKFDHKNDIFDSYNDDFYEPSIIKKANIQIDNGYDLKINLVKKALKLDLYKAIEVSSIEKAYSDKKFDKVMCFSSVYHFNNPKAILLKIKDFISEDGVLCINTISPSMIDFYSIMDKQYDANFVKFIDRGMRDLWPSVYSFKEWESIFKDAGFIVKKVTTVMPKSFSPIWNIGMRSFASQHISLYNLAKKYNSKEAAIIKQEYIDRALSFSGSFEINGAMHENDSAHLWVLERKF